MSTPTITWDRYAVPTITADDDRGAVWGIGYAQAVAHAREVLELYGRARGTAAALWGAAYADTDVLHAQLGLTEALDVWWDGQAPETREKLAAFAEGFNAACAEDPARGGDRRDALPLSARDVLAHTLRVFTNFTSMDTRGLAFSPTAFRDAGSSAWAVAAKRSTTGGAMLVINPHLAWKGYHRFFQARTVSPGRTFDGIMLVGYPWQNMGWSPRVGWAHTVNRIPVMTVYELQTDGDGYVFDGETRAYEVDREHKVAVAGEEPRIVRERRSVHGPVVTAPDGVDVAVQLAGVLSHRPLTGSLETWWQLSKAGTVAELVDLVDASPLPLYNLIGADSSGSVAAVSCGTPAVLPGGYADSTRRLPGHESAALVTEVHDQRRMPRAIDPEGGWTQNVNDPPWFFCDPQPDPADFAPGVAMNEPDELRCAASRAFLRGTDPISPEALLALKFKTHSDLADAVLEQLCDAAAGEPDLAEAVAALRAWDRDADGAGYPVFYLWGALSLAATLDNAFLVEPVPGELPVGLSDPAASVAVLQQVVGLFGLLGVPVGARMGEIATMSDGVSTVPASGGTGIDGIFKVMVAAPGAGGWQAGFGDTYTALVQWDADGTVTGNDLLLYGNTTEPSAPQRESEIELYAASRLRPT